MREPWAGTWKRLRFLLEPSPHLAPMATYVYETIPQKRGQKPRQFEVQQKMTEPALTHCPETGEPVRRVLVGGSIITRGTSILSMNNRAGRGNR
jgi:predicted nucleic acid-binding Zn ribbon protein